MTIFKVGDRIRFKKVAYDFWERWFKESFKFDAVVTIEEVFGDKVSFKESVDNVSCIYRIEHVQEVDKDGQMKLIFKWGG